MQKWVATFRRARPSLLRRPGPLRRLSSNSHVEHISVPCASNGSVDLSLHNVFQHPASTPLVIWMPPYAAPGLWNKPGSMVPDWLTKYPTVVINYRWPYSSPRLETIPPSLAPSQDAGGTLSWPNPIHDTLFGYSWILENLSPPSYGRRDVYVFGSYLGAGLAASLALTESHAHQAMAVRGLVAYNGIYNWTTFLPDHPIHRTKGASILELSLPGMNDEQSLMFRHLTEQVPLLFDTPAMLFDPFASPSLLFHNPGLLVPPEFGSSALSRAIDEIAEGDMDAPAPVFPLADSPLKTPRKSHLVFPPRRSTLKIPPTLLLYDTLPPPKIAMPSRGRSRKRKPTPVGNSFLAQAEELAGLMRRSVEKLELKERQKWDDELEGWEDEPWRRVQAANVETEKEFDHIGMGPAGQSLAQGWLADRVG